MRREEEHERHNEQSGHLEDPQQRAPADDAHREERQQHAAGSPPNSWNDCTALTACCRAAGGSVRTSASPGTICCGICWIAPNAAPKLHANMIVVTIVVRRNCGANSSPMLGRLSVPAAFFSRQTGDSGRNGRMTISGIAGITPDISV